MTRFAYEPTEKLIQGHVPQVRTARDLLRHLTVENADAIAQSDAVERWLASHQADDLLTASLIRQGLPTKGRASVKRVPEGLTVYDVPGGEVFVVLDSTVSVKAWEAWRRVGEASRTTAKGQHQPELPTSR